MNVRLLMPAAIIALLLMPLFSAYAGNPTLVDGKLVYPEQESKVYFDKITPEQLLMAIYVNHQLNSLYDQVSEKKFSLKDMRKLLQSSKDQKIEKIGNIPVNLDLSTWPVVDAASFDQHSLLWIEGKPVLNDKKTLSNIQNRIKSGELQFQTQPSESQIQEAIWNTYIKLVPESPPEETVQIALKKLQESQALVKSPSKISFDIGCNTGRDGKLLLKQGWTVYAIDPAQEALDQFKKAAEGIPAGKLVLQKADFDSMNLEVTPEKATLINSSYTLPYAGDSFQKAWIRIIDKLERGGLFSGQFFGIRDDLHGKPGIFTVDRKGLDQLLSRFEILYLQEKEWEGQRVDGTKKHWHVFDLVLRKK